jgi:hypothetical protein
MHIKKHISFTALRMWTSHIFKQIPEWRQASKVDISIHDAMMSGLACMYFQDPSLAQFQRQLQDARNLNNLKTLFAVEVVPKESQMRNIIDQVPSSYFEQVFKRFYQNLQRGKHLESMQIFPKTYYFPIDGSQFFSSNDINCKQCLTRKEEEEEGDEEEECSKKVKRGKSRGKKKYSHQVLQCGIMHPDCKQVIPFMPEQIVNTDGRDKQDCEMNAAKRLLKKLDQNFPRLGLLIGGDALYSKQPIIEDARSYGMNYLFVAKPDDHKYMMEWLGAYDKLDELWMTDDQGREHHYEWMNDVPLHGGKHSINVNFLRCTITGKKKKKEYKKSVPYKNTWVTDWKISKENVATLARAGRCRWKVENECFNAMKNQGYCMEHNYGHGTKNLAFNFYLLTLAAFSMHQIFEMTDSLYQACRQKYGSKMLLWNTLKHSIMNIVFDNWEQLLGFVLKPDEYRLVPNTS